LVQGAEKEVFTEYWGKDQRAKTTKRVGKIEKAYK
jgi:hypothetical protein